jgi:hypothetical protein
MIAKSTKAMAAPRPQSCPAKAEVYDRYEGVSVVLAGPPCVPV